MAVTLLQKLLHRWACCTNGMLQPPYLEPHFITALCCAAMR
jgi:hypothetical protein